ncbi:calcium-binding protein [Aureimonas sp. AU22]|uniref:calcium-binding protein n=1 Tax=Aureimonas sp. AU22 TaxID=1638162 RepID=UPI00070577FA|nr:calcium-binding protein [Aureimonas sp. AU22]BAT29907.1 putative calcium-binding protein [Aureimonas sp. AU22]
MIYDRSTETLSGLQLLGEGDNRLIAGGYVGAAVVGNSGNDTFETASTGGTYAYSQFFGGAGDDRLIIKDIDTVAQGVNFIGGAGIDTLELTAGSRITMTNDAFGTTISYGQTGGTISVTEVERYIIKGSADADALAGSAGDDWLDGKGGLDTFQGSAGNDGYVFDTVGERVVGETANGGIDTIWATISVDLRDNANVENLRLQGGNINGTGNELNNLITGSTGNNVIAGGAGNDQLWGKGGADTFVFAEFGSANRDTIFDFDADDKIQLDSSVFSGLTSDGGVLAMTDFVIGTKATANHAQVLYNSNTGVLSYDADGTGGGAAQEIASIGKKLGFFDHTDILLA